MGTMFFPDEVSQFLNVRVGKNNVRYCGTCRRESPGGSNYSYVRGVIDNEWDSLRICAMAENGMCVAICGSNAYAYQNDTCKNGIDFARKFGGYITDLNVTNSGANIVLFGENGYYQDGCPSKFVEYLSKYNHEKRAILSASFNDEGDYCIVTDENYCYTNGLTYFVKNAKDRFGYFRYVFISELGRIAICENGIYYENVPSIIEQILGTIEFVPDYIKFTDTGYYCISNKKGAAWYNI